MYSKLPSSLLKPKLHRPFTGRLIFPVNCTRQTRFTDVAEGWHALAARCTAVQACLQHNHQQTFRLIGMTILQVTC